MRPRLHRPHVPPTDAGGAQPQSGPVFAGGGRRPADTEPSDGGACPGGRGYGLLRRREGNRPGQRLGGGGRGGYSRCAGAASQGGQPDPGGASPGAANLPYPQPHRGPAAQQLQALSLCPPKAHPGGRDRPACGGIPAAHGGGRPRQPPPGAAHRRGN